METKKFELGEKVLYRKKYKVTIIGVWKPGELIHYAISLIDKNAEFHTGKNIKDTCLKGVEFLETARDGYTWVMGSSIEKIEY